MGYDIVAYYNINQSIADSYIKENAVNLNDPKSYKELVKFLYKHSTGLDYTENTYVIYHYNKKLGLHELTDFFGVNFVRDDDRLSNLRYHAILAEKVGKPYPDCLHKYNMLMIRNKANAKRIANAIRVFFSDDSDLLCYADWLEKTAKYCDFYEESY